MACTGAALGPLLAGLLSARGWSQVFYMLMTADFLALLVSAGAPPGRRARVGGAANVFVPVVCSQLLLRLVTKEVTSHKSRPAAAVE